MRIVTGKLSVDGREYLYAPIRSIEGFEALPFSLRVLLENLARQFAKGSDTSEEIAALLRREHGRGLNFMPARVFLQDLLGIPLLVDLAALRDAVSEAGNDANAVNPKVPADLVIDHSLRVDVSASSAARRINLELEYERNAERFSFLRWCQGSFNKLRVVPPGKGIMHQINLEYLAKVVWTEETDGGTWAFPDTLVGTDSHTTMINGLGVLGWGVGGIEAEAVMLGKAVSVPLPKVVGVEVSGVLAEGITPTDLVLTITEQLRKTGVVGKFVEFFGPGLDALPLADRGTIANMAPEYGATCVYFPVDRRTIDYLRMTGRDDHQVELVEAWCRHQGLWRDESTAAPKFDQVLHLNLGDVRPSIAGPFNPEDRIDLGSSAAAFREHHEILAKVPVSDRSVPVDGESFALKDGAIVIAAITSCTNTSNPFNIIAAGLVARNALARNLLPKPWVKTSFAPGSQVTAAMLERAGLQSALDALGFQVIGFGCTTCNGMSGPIPAPIAKAIEGEKLVATAVLSGNRNFEGRIHPNVRAAYLASPPLVVAYSLAGSMTVDLVREPLGTDQQGKDVFLRDLWPTNEEIQSFLRKAIDPALFRVKYADVFQGDSTWNSLGQGGGKLYPWSEASTYIRRPPYFDGLSAAPSPPSALLNMRPLAILGDSITTDHISPSGAITAGSPASNYLLSLGVPAEEFNSYGTRRGNHNVVMRSIFANIRLRNQMVPGTEGGMTRLMPDGNVMSMFGAAIEYKQRGVSLVIVAGRNYGCGSSRDAAAKGAMLLGVKAVVAESFERIHRTNLIGMGVLPLVFEDGVTAAALGLDGSEAISLPQLGPQVGVRSSLWCHISRANSTTTEISVTAAIETNEEVAHWRNGGILPFVWRDYMSGMERAV